MAFTDEVEEFPHVTSWMMNCIATWSLSWGETSRPGGIVKFHPYVSECIIYTPRGKTTLERTPDPWDPNRMAARRLRCVTLTAWIALASAAARLPTEVARSACALARNDCSRKGRRPLRAGGGCFFFCSQQLVEKNMIRIKEPYHKKDPGSLIFGKKFFF